MHTVWESCLSVKRYCRLSIKSKGEHFSTCEIIADHRVPCTNPLLRMRSGVASNGKSGYLGAFIGVSPSGKA
ncbi:hypothetical protein, partial [Hyphomonas sp. UBA2515]|uniref:hypothetical protein n=1 Tax=Hyphomonas sp. UBA2515 TaxID=1946618 RepID=UPI0025BE4CCF